MIEERARILLVDDTPANLIALEAQLSDLDCEILRADNGNVALRLLLKHSFAVMLLDVQMPEMDGYEVARYARENPQTRDVPIIFVTAMHETETNRLRSYGAGAVDLLFKPVDPYVLRSKVQIFVELYRQRQRLVAEVTAHRKTSTELSAANRELAAVSTAKSDFLSMMSHELRTPLNAIMGFSELVIDEHAGPLNPTQQRFMSNVHASAAHLLTLINDFLDLSKIEAGRLEISIGRCSPKALAAEAIGTLQQLANAKGIALTLDAPIADPPVIATDHLRTKQVLYNLLSNAIKFTPASGAVTVSFAVSEDGRLLRTSVRDTGPGISPDDLTRLFRPYTQLVNAGQAPHSGTGLGLSLTKRLVELMGGSAGVESEIGKGSHFFFDLPIDGAERKETGT